MKFALALGGTTVTARPGVPVGPELNGHGREWYSSRHTSLIGFVESAGLWAVASAPNPLAHVD